MTTAPSPPKTGRVLLISTLVADFDTTVTGIQNAITLYTLVMAAFMIAGAKVGDIIGRKRLRDRPVRLFGRYHRHRPLPHAGCVHLRLVRAGGPRFRDDAAGHVVAHSVELRCRSGVFPAPTRVSPPSPASPASRPASAPAPNAEAGQTALTVVYAGLALAGLLGLAAAARLPTDRRAGRGTV
jgi:hypothetical protein